MTIPKIIHQTAPNNSENWHPIWKECQKSWLKHHQDFQYFLWNDNDIEKLIKDCYPEYLNFYNSLPYKIIKIDFARFCILHQHGGIYADMDVFCYKNFYSMLENDLYIVESWEEWGEKIQNSLMVSSPKNIFWEKCMRYSAEQYENFTSVDFQNNYCNSIFSICGPKFLSQILNSTVSILSKEFFNPQLENQFNRAKNNYKSQEYINAYDDFIRLNNQNDAIITRHYLTSTWIL